MSPPRSASRRAIVADRFRHFAAIDWSGARGERHAGIAVALCAAGTGAPVLVAPDRRWSRGEVLAWLLEALPVETLVGFDFGTSFPFLDHGAFFPGWDESPPDARALWALIDRRCRCDPHLGAATFVAHPEVARHLRQQGRVGDRFEAGRGRLRLSERAQLGAGLNPVSNLNLVGAAQVGKASLTGMRLLHRLDRRLPVWPFDADPGHGALVVEIYTSLAARAAGRPAGRTKMRDVATLNAALATLGSEAVPGSGAIADHRSDALLTAAWLRTAAPRTATWHPRALTPRVAATEGWTFGVV